MSLTNNREQGDLNTVMRSISETGTKLKTNKEKDAHLDPLFGMLDHFVTQKLGGNESLDTIIQSGANTDGLTGTGPAVKVIPHLERRQRTK